MDLKEVPLEGIDRNDGRFRVSLADPSPMLRLSLLEIGMNSPPLLRTESDRFTIVSGFARVACAADLGWKTIPALCLGGRETDERRCLLRSYHETAAQRDLTPVEKASLLARLERVAGYSRQEILYTFFPQLQLPPERTTWERLRRVGAWPEPLLRKAHAAGLGLIPLQLLGDLPAGEAAAAVTFLAHYRWGSSRQREVCGWLLDVARLQRCGVAELIAAGAAQLPPEAARLPLPQRAEQLRQWLRRQRYPRLTEVEDSFVEVRRALRVPQQIALQEPAGFEGSQYRVQFQFRSRTEYNQALAHLQRLGGEPRFGDLFRFV